MPAPSSGIALWACVLVTWSEPYLRHVEAADSMCTPTNLQRFGEWPTVLDSSIYWFGFADSAEKATGGPSSYYDPSKPTMLYFHGWTGIGNGWTSLCKRITTQCHPDICPNGGGQNLVDAWLKAGWNVGFFYWDQFADEACVRDAEQKIWFDRQGDGLRWKSYNVNTGQSTYQSHQDLEDSNVADICVRNVKMAMGSFSGPQVRFVGHSLGSQLAARCAALLHVENHPAAPQRIAMLEPYFSKEGGAGLGHFSFTPGCTAKASGGGMGDFAAESTVSEVQKMWDSKKVVTEVYKSSLLTEKSSDDSNSAYSALKSMVKHGAAGSLENSLIGHLGAGEREQGLEKLATLVEYRPDWCVSVASDTTGDVQHMVCRHCAVMPLYLLSFGRTPPPLSPQPTLNMAQPGSALSSCMTPSAACSDGEIREWVQRQHDMGPDQGWSQVLGSDTFTEADDAYAINPSIEQGFQLGLSSANAIVEKTARELPTENKEPMWRQTITSPQLLIPVLLVCVLGVAGIAFFALRRMGDGGDEDSDEDEGLTTSRSMMDDELKAKGYAGLIPAPSDRSESGSFGGTQALLGPGPASARPAYGGQSP